MEESVDGKFAGLIQDCLNDGEEVVTRNSKVKRLIGVTVHLHSTPLVSLRKTAWKSALREMEWFLSGSSSIDDLHPSVRDWWSPWAGPSGLVLFNYSKQFRRFHGSGGPVDSIELLVEGIRKHPNSRRNLITTWNTQEMNDPACEITNCHGTVIQAFVVGGNRLRLLTYQRSADLICGLPHNWIQYAALHLWLCARTGLLVDRLTWVGGDLHLYDAHRELALEMNSARHRCPPTPLLCYFPQGSERFLADDFYLDGEYRPVIDKRAEMVV